MPFEVYGDGHFQNDTGGLFSLRHGKDLTLSRQAVIRLVMLEEAQRPKHLRVVGVVTLSAQIAAPPSCGKDGSQ